MGKLVGKAQYRDILLGAGLLWATLALVLWPEQSMEAMRDGLRLCGNVILPSLFPFFVLSSLVVELGMSRYGPAFILGVVGAGVFGSGTAGLLLYLAHLLASLTVGALFRFYKPREGPQTVRSRGPQFQTVSFPRAFTSSVTGALQSTLNICAFILFFTVFLRILASAGILEALGRLLSVLLAPLGMDQTWAERLLTGLVEVSSGVSSLTDGALSGRLSMAAFMLGWAGVSVHCQVLAFLGDSGLSASTYVAGKLLHGTISAVLVRLLFQAVPLSSPASVYLAEQTEAIAHLDFQRALTLSAVASWGVWLLFLALTVYVVQKNSGKEGRRVV